MNVCSLRFIEGEGHQKELFILKQIIIVSCCLLLKFLSDVFLLLIVFKRFH